MNDKFNKWNFDLQWSAIDLINLLEHDSSDEL